MTRALVTGAAGFIGSHLVRRLVTDGDDVVALYRPGGDPWRLADVADQVRLTLVDLNDPEAVTTAFRRAHPDRSYHAAGGPRTGGGGPAMTANVVNAAAAASVAVLVVTGDAFDYRSTGRPLQESERAPAEFDHGRLARAGTDHAGRFGRVAGVATVTLRLFSIFGPDDHRQRLVPRLMAAARTGQTVALSDPAVVRDWVYVDDAVDAYVRAADWALGASTSSTTPVFNVGSGRATTIGQLVGVVGSLSGAPLHVGWGCYPTDDHDRGWWVADPTTTRQVLGWAPRWSLENGLSALLASDRAAP